MKRKKVLPLPASYTDEEHIDAELTNNHLVPCLPAAEASVPESNAAEAKPKVKTRPLENDSDPSEFDVIDVIDSNSVDRLSGQPEATGLQLPVGCTEPELLVVTNDAVSSAIEVELEEASVTQDIFLVPSFPPEFKEEDEQPTTTSSSTTSTTSTTSITSTTSTTSSSAAAPLPAEELRSPLTGPISSQNELPITVQEEEAEEEHQPEVEEEDPVQPETNISDVAVSVDVEQPAAKFNCVVKEEPINHFISGN